MNSSTKSCKLRIREIEDFHNQVMLLSSRVKPDNNNRVEINHLWNSETALRERENLLFLRNLVHYLMLMILHRNRRKRLKLIRKRIRSSIVLKKINLYQGLLEPLMPQVKKMRYLESWWLLLSKCLIESIGINILLIVGI